MHFKSVSLTSNEVWRSIALRGKAYLYQDCPGRRPLDSARSCHAFGGPQADRGLSASSL